MERLFSNIVGTYVYVDDELRPATSVKDVVMDAENGKLLALVVDAGSKMVILPVDIYSWGDVVKIHGLQAIGDGREVIKVNKVWESGVRIYGNKVETKDGKLLGRVNDFALEGESLILKKIIVSKGFLGLVRWGGRVIASNKIVEVLRNKIVVENDVETVSEGEGVIGKAVAG